jgi:hypothetical protein
MFYYQPVVAIVQLPVFITNWLPFECVNQKIKVTSIKMPY